MLLGLWATVSVRVRYPLCCSRRLSVDYEIPRPLCIPSPFSSPCPEPEKLCKSFPSAESLRNIIIILGLTRVAADIHGVRSRVALCQALPKGFRLLIPQSESQIHMISICFQRYAAGVNNRDSWLRGSETLSGAGVFLGFRDFAWEFPEKPAELSDF